MYPLPATPAESEPVPSESERTSQEVFLTWFIRAATIAYLAGATIQVCRNDEVRLELMHAAIKVLQNMARFFGSLALVTEKNYNSYVDTLH